MPPRVRRSGLAAVEPLGRFLTRVSPASQTREVLCFRRTGHKIRFSQVALARRLRTMGAMGFVGRDKQSAGQHSQSSVANHDGTTGGAGVAQLEHLFQGGGSRRPEAVADIMQQFPNEQAAMVEMLQSTRGNAFVQQVLRVAALREGLVATDGRSDHGRASIPAAHQRSQHARTTNAAHADAPTSTASDPLALSDADAEQRAGSSEQIIAALHGRIGPWEPKLPALLAQAKAPGDDAARQSMMTAFASLLEDAEHVRQDLQQLEAAAVDDMVHAKAAAGKAHAVAEQARIRAEASAKAARWAARFLGTVRAMQGAFEMYVGCGASATGIGAVLGGAAMCIHGADSLNTGAREMWSGNSQHTQISQSVAGVATVAGADPNTAATIGDYGDVAFGMLGAGAVMKSTPVRYQEPVTSVPKATAVEGIENGGERNRMYQPTTTPNTALPKGLAGTTDSYGNIQYDPRLPPNEVALTIAHESVHSWLSPKALNRLRDFRARLGFAAYDKIQLCRYLEEALAETYAQVKVNGLRAIPEGLSFPLAPEYNLRLSVVLAEGMIGTIVYGGVVYAVYETASK